MFRLKTYQQNALDALEAFLSQARLSTVAEAFEISLRNQGKQSWPYRHYDFAEVPYVCLRLPTGGGKTVLGSHTVKVAARAYLEQDYPIVLWLVPTNTIQQQTLEALKTPGHPYRVELDRAFDQRVRVLDADEVTQIRPQDIGSQLIVVVTTLANLRVTNTGDRKIYAYHENFEPHFSGIDPNTPNLERVVESDLQEQGLGPTQLGKIKYSFANLLALKRPLVIMDEAHNARTPLTFETLKRVHPACVVEFTATPDQSTTSASNVLFHVTAAELKAEEMIKLPIMLTEHKDWQEAVRDAVLTRTKLNTEAQKDPDYIRPIVLFQADKKNGEVPWERLRDFLINEQNIDEQKIAVVTGTQRELDGLNLLSPSCPIELIITVEALKEGWDCPFAYVFCSVRDIRSNKDAEQLLGRVLRMPFAKRRPVEALNRAYAHLASPGFAQVAKSLTDNLINMGFEAMEVPAHIRHGDADDLFSDQTPTHQPEPPLTLQLSTRPALDENELSLSDSMRLTETNEGFTLEVKGQVDEKLQSCISKSLKGKEKKETLELIEQHNARIEASKSPSEQGVPFAPLPQLCLQQQGELELLEPESFLFLNGDWSPLDFTIELPGFSLQENATTFEVDMEGKKVSYQVAEEKAVYNLNMVATDISEDDLARWLDRELRTHYLNQSVLHAFVVKTLSHLTQERGISLTALLRSKFLLVKAIRQRLAILQEKASSQGFQQALFENALPMKSCFDYSYEFFPGLYPARPPYYSGGYKFRKHYYPYIEDLKVDGEEFLCAQAIDANSQIKHWVRNLVDRQQASFRLPLSKGWFYPDFVVELNDGRTLVVEYKGAVYRSNDDSRVKNAVGLRWAESSQGKCLFLMAVETDDQGRNVYQQIDALISS